ncbi:PaaX family transcriptional regulator C-terminal domain-containing protein [Microbacterium sp.]|uniref:PaaX family transcriptional regulator C-terminal domain-containing protein n=1 Tax=Microbacterium sp. TaxID=51671 RepID=UPI0025F6C9E9|nr:PaaX family transcriptional regulator C-terminal domain-containing protein [Microbacterium sp.]
MRTDVADPLGSRSPKQLLFAALAEQRLMGVRTPLRASTYIAVLGEAGVHPATTRAKLDRLVVEGYLSRMRGSRGVEYSLTGPGDDTLRAIQNRMDAPRPFAPNGSGWTLVTFSVPENHRAARQRLRAALTWEGFVPVRDGLWVAPGEADLDAALDPMAEELVGSSVIAFRAQDLARYSLAGTAARTWDIENARSAHETFAGLWGPDATDMDDLTDLARLMLLGADWYALVRTDPRLPSDYLGDDWPAELSTQIYRSRRDEFMRSAHDRFFAAIRR